MDSFFANGSSWGAPEDPLLVPCVWSAALNNTYLGGYVHGAPMSFTTLAGAKAACLDAGNVYTCGGVVSRQNGAGPFELRNGLKPKPVPAADGEASYVLKNRNECVPAPHVEVWRNRSAAAYGAVTRADGPSARWIYQGYALTIGGNLGPASDGAWALDRLHSFTSPVPEGQFILMDMSAHGDGQFKKWKGQWQVRVRAENDTFHAMIPQRFGHRIGKCA